MFYQILIIIAFLFLPAITHSVQSPEYNLEVSFDIPNSKISGIVNIDVQAKQELIFHTGNLTISEVKLNKQEINFNAQNGILKILPDQNGIIEIRYDGVFDGKQHAHTPHREVIPNTISEQGISLTQIWYPWLNRLLIYNLTAVLPEGYEAVSEAEHIEKITKNGKTKFIFDFPHLVDGINFVASDRYEVIKDYFNEIEIYAYFFPEVVEFANEYISYTKKYLALYERLIGKYPYKRFSIVANFLPTGYSMPTFTVLGENVIRLPFIVRTSLGHEILHQWFGNLVYIDYERGNWAEGLTTYLADHLYEELESKGWEYRKQILINYESYVTDKNEFPIKDFHGRVDFVTRSIGYGKAAMVFHMLKDLVGEEVFYRSLRDFVYEQKFQRASWDNLIEVFERNAKEDLDWFFKQWIDEKGIPEINLTDARVRQNGSKFEVSFNIIQRSQDYIIDVPVSFYYLNGDKKTDSFRIDKQKNSFNVLLDYEPAMIVMDEDYDIARRLSQEEFPPVIARLLGDERIIIALPVSDKDAYKNIIDTFEKRGGTKKESQDIKHSDIKDASLVILGGDNPLIERLYGKVNIKDAGFNLTVKENPWNPRKVVGIFSAKSKEESILAFRKIFHYGKYSELSFEKGRNVFKNIEESQRGIKIWQREEAVAIKIDEIKTLSNVIESVSDRRIIYVGETHDQFAHHAVQLDIIKGLYRKGRQIAIGMEMFQRPFQGVLDEYISGKIDEREFLKRSEYFERWGFDYNLYKPIVDFARSKQIPIVALNISREITRKVSTGGIDTLTEDEKKLIPLDMDFSDNEYRERLKEVFNRHAFLNREFDHFYQAQILWDEVMAMSIYEFLKENTDYQMAVLAGSGHLSHASGIPQRTFRRNGYDYAIILNDAALQDGIADYVIFPKPIVGITAPKLMALLREYHGKIKIEMFPKNSVSEKAGLKKGDIILSLDDVPIKNISDIWLHLFYKKSGDMVKAKILRERFLLSDKEIEIEIKL